MKTSHAFQGCAKTVFWLHTARLANPEKPQTHPIASDFHEPHSDTPRHPPDIPQTPPTPLQASWDANRRQQTPPDDNRRHQTPPDILKQHLSVSWGVWGCLSVSVDVSCCLLASHFPQRGLGGVLGMSGGCLEVSEWYSWRSEAFECVWGVSGFSVLVVWSHNAILAQPWKASLVFIWLYWDIKISKCLYLSLTKVVGFCRFFVF